MVPRLLVSMLVDQCLVVQLGRSWMASIRVGPGVQLVQGENYAYSRVLGHGQPYFSIALIRVVLPEFIPPSSGNFLPGAAEV
jgi:hypothetical protein